MGLETTLDFEIDTGGIRPTPFEFKKGISSWADGDRKLAKDYVFDVMSKDSKGITSYFSKVFSRQFPDHNDVDDVIATGFLNMANGAGTYKGGRVGGFSENKELRSWVGRIFNNAGHKFFKISDRCGVYHANEILPSDLASRSSNPLEILSAAEDVETVKEGFVTMAGMYFSAFGKLSDREQRVLRGVEVDGKTYSAVGEETGIHVANIKMIIHRARKKIFKRFEYSDSPLMVAI